MKTIKHPLDVFDVPDGTVIYNADRTKSWTLFFENVLGKINGSPSIRHVSIATLNSEDDVITFPLDAIADNGGTLYYEVEE